MASTVNPIPPGFSTVTPHLTIQQGASGYIDFLKRAFGAVELDRSPGPGGKLMHATVKIGESKLMLNDHFPEFGSPQIAEGAWPIFIHLYVPDADATFANAIEAGATPIMPLMDQFWGDRYGLVQDPFGFRWSIATHKEDLTPEQIGERAAKAFARFDEKHGSAGQ